MPAPKRIEVRIGGTHYTLLSGDDETYSRRVAAQADQLVRRILQSNPSLNQTSALVLGLVNAVDENLRLSTQVEVMESRLADFEGRVAESRSEMLRYKERMDAVNTEILRLRTALDKAEKDARQTPRAAEADFAGRTQTTFPDYPPTPAPDAPRPEEEC